jgi:hypothetical protein
MLQSIRGLFGKDIGERKLIDVNESVRKALQILREELDYHRVTVRTQLAPLLPWPIAGGLHQLD